MTAPLYNYQQQLIAGEEFVGAIGGNTKIVKIPLTVTAGAYADKDSIGGKITITNAMRKNGGTGVLQTVTVMDRSGVKPTGNILIFDSNPTAATITNDAKFVASTDDLKVIATVPVASADYVVPGDTKAFASIKNLGLPVAAVGSADLYAAFVTNGTPTFGSTSDVQLVFGFLRD